ncbi:MAG TPA: ABC transporter permease [Spirochaetia bacterium]|nr:ABC transporter permease [Spirochaetia bacterium]
MTDLLARALMMSTPLLFGSIAEVFAERAGVMVCAVEGIFLLGALGGFVGDYASHRLAVGIMLAALVGIIYAAFYGWITVYLKQHQIVTGTAFNLLATGLSAFFMRAVFGVPIVPLTVEPLPVLAVPVLSRIPYVGAILFHQNVLTYCMYLIVPLAWFVLYRTSIGLTIRSTGENPEAADVAGIRVERIRFSVVLLAGAMGGIAGAFYSIGYLGMFTTNIIGGRGWIAFAICFLGNWNPLGALAGTLIFGVAEAIAISMQSSGSLTLPNELFIALPYILTIALTILRRSFNVPGKLGVPYRKEN